MKRETIDKKIANIEQYIEELKASIEKSKAQLADARKNLGKWMHRKVMYNNYHSRDGEKRKQKTRRRTNYDTLDKIFMEIELKYGSGVNQ